MNASPGWCAAILAGVLWGAPADAADALQGRDTYIRVGCWSCHGYEGQGGIAGPKLAPDPLPFEAFAVVVRRTIAEMPAYSPQVLSDEALAAIYAYVMSVAPSPEPDSIPLLR
jgi:mono/diheme cytochrome c family protein